MRKTILIVGADVPGCRALARLASAIGYGAALASVATLQAQLRRVHPDALVVDAGSLSPEASRALVQRVRRETAVPLICAIGWGDAGIADLLDAGADDVVRKTITAAELQARLCAQFRRRQGNPTQA